MAKSWIRFSKSELDPVIVTLTFFMKRANQEKADRFSRVLGTRIAPTG